jgi:hypothetical protein
VQVSESSHISAREYLEEVHRTATKFLSEYTSKQSKFLAKERMTARGIGLTTLSKFTTRESSANLTFTGTMRK